MFTPLFTSALGSLRSELYAHGSATVGTVQQLAGAAGTALFRHGPVHALGRQPRRGHRRAARRRRRCPGRVPVGRDHLARRAGVVAARAASARRPRAAHARPLRSPATAGSREGAGRRAVRGATPVHPSDDRCVAEPLVTPDGRYLVVRGRLWRRTNPDLPEDRRQELVDELMAARRAKRQALDAGTTRRGRPRGPGSTPPSTAWGSAAGVVGRRRPRPDPAPGADDGVRRLVRRSGPVVGSPPPPVRGRTGDRQDGGGGAEAGSHRRGHPATEPRRRGARPVPGSDGDRPVPPSPAGPVGRPLRARTGLPPTPRRPAGDDHCVAAGRRGRTRGRTGRCGPTSPPASTPTDRRRSRCSTTGGGTSTPTATCAGRSSWTTSSPAARCPDDRGVRRPRGVRRAAAEEPQRRVRRADDRYARCLVDEVLARVGREHRLSDDPADAVVVGGSSGGERGVHRRVAPARPFGQAVCFLASFAQMPGGNPYPRLLADGARRPVRWFLRAAAAGAQLVRGEPPRRRRAGRVRARRAPGRRGRRPQPAARRGPPPGRPAVGAGILHLTHALH